MSYLSEAETSEFFPSYSQLTEPHSQLLLPSPIGASDQKALRKMETHISLCAKIMAVFRSPYGVSKEVTNAFN